MAKAKKKVVRKPVKKKAKKATVKTNADKFAKAAKIKAKKQWAQVKKKFIAAEKKTKLMIDKHPEQAALIAAGLGAAIGSAVTAVIKRRKKKKK